MPKYFTEKDPLHLTALKKQNQEYQAQQNQARKKANNIATDLENHWNDIEPVIQQLVAESVRQTLQKQLDDSKEPYQDTVYLILNQTSNITSPLADLPEKYQTEAGYQALSQVIHKHDPALVAMATFAGGNIVKAAKPCLELSFTYKHLLSDSKVINLKELLQQAGFTEFEIMDFGLEYGETLVIKY